MKNGKNEGDGWNVTKQGGETMITTRVRKVTMVYIYQ